MTLIAYCQKKKMCLNIIDAKDVSYTLESCRKREMKVLRTFILKTTKLLSMLSRVQNSHATKVCRYFVGQLVLYEFLIALWQFLFRTQCTNYCWTQTTWHNIICIPHTTFTPLKLYFGKNKKIKETRKYIRLYNQFHWCS